jgi:ketosteroid isomerase-like protein
VEFRPADVGFCRAPTNAIIASMSGANVEIVRMIVDAANRRAWDEVGSFYAPDIVVRQWNTIDASTYAGREQVLTFLRDWVETFEGHLAAEITEELEQGDRVVVCLLFHWRGRGSDMEGVARRWWAYRFRSGIVADIEIHDDRDQAISAAGIRQT